jgi:hypothetical protein
MYTTRSLVLESSSLRLHMLLKGTKMDETPGVGHISAEIMQERS